MQTSPEAEAARLAAVRRYAILDTPPEGAFDRITALAAKLFDVPIAIISLVDTDRIWFKSHHGLETSQTDRSPGLCASAIITDRAYILPDARKDPRALANPLVAGELGLRFYLGIPLRTSDGHNLGTLCVIDRAPRSVTDDQVAQLEQLAAIVMDEMELRLSARQAVARAADLGDEIEHRVMNSLQLVSTLLTLQAQAAGDSIAAEQLTFAAKRVAAAAEMHRHVRIRDGAEIVSSKRYLEQLCGDLSSLVRAARGDGVEIETIDADFPADRMMALGLIVNELVLEAAKHGVGRVAVSLRGGESLYALSVAARGEWLPGGLDDASAGVGVKAACRLIGQLRGDFLVDQGKGQRETTITISFPAAIPSRPGFAEILAELRADQHDDDGTLLIKP